MESHQKRPIVNIPPIKNPDNDWPRTEEKVNIFADHLQRVFTLLPSLNDKDKNEIFLTKFSQDSASAR